MRDNEFRKLQSKCENALRKWERDNNPKIYVSSNDYYGGWLKLFQYLLD